MKKRILLIIGVVIIPIICSAQTDWANLAKYAKANNEVTIRPEAVFIGDSITEGWYDVDSEFFHTNNFLGRGISGQTTTQMLCRFRKDVIDLKPKYVVILAGTNDIARNNGPIELEDIFGNIVSMCELAKLHKIKPVICSVLPCKQYLWRPEITDAGEQINRLNAMLKDYAKQNKMIYVDYHTSMKDDENGLPEKLSYDGCHPTQAGYNVMKDIILSRLQ